MKAPTSSQLRILRLLAAGGVIADCVAAMAVRAAGYHVIVNKIAVQRVTPRIVHEMFLGGWIAFDGERWKLTPFGQQVVDVKTFVRAFVDAQRSA